MIALNDIKNAITKRLYNFTSLTIYGEVNEKELKKPCLCVDIIPIYSTKRNVDLFNKSLLIDIVYLTVKQSKTENYAMIDNMQLIFDKSLKVGETYFHILQLDSKIVENVLHTQFKLNYLDGIDDFTVDIPITDEETGIPSVKTITLKNSELDEELGYKEDTIKIMQELEIK